jgi:hypothetical protein
VTDAQIEETILGLLAKRDPGKTICPSDAARARGAIRLRATEPLS